MFRRFKLDRESVRPLVILDTHTTSPPVEKETNADVAQEKPSLFMRANRIYERSRRPIRRKGAGII